VRSRHLGQPKGRAGRRASVKGPGAPGRSGGAKVAREIEGHGLRIGAHLGRQRADLGGGSAAGPQIAGQESGYAG